MKRYNVKPSKREGWWVVFAAILFFIVTILMIIIAGCAAPASVSGSPAPPANGVLASIRTWSIIGIGIVMFFACWNTMKIYKAALSGLGIMMALAITCMYFEKWFALITFITLGAGFLLAITSLFVKHKGIFLAWRKK